ncbi:MAG: hypothetical protein PHE83_12685 [Opitutaceae bacterium]|nr:hypothetical protein [Opitutaceae bacterium]
MAPDGKDFFGGAARSQGAEGQGQRGKDEELKAKRASVPQCFARIRAYPRDPWFRFASRNGLNGLDAAVFLVSLRVLCDLRVRYYFADEGVAAPALPSLFSALFALL